MSQQRYSCVPAAPVKNQPFNRFKNQIALAYEGDTDQTIDSKLETKSSINDIF